ncbi:hypothetical protein EJ06DRAFT_532173 [Trichodelitschia bisporula]|uniref:Carrier domain-containing protein n=1 Tax=Trichodelitschia bisporula TaxID=703511 RepID=A0A6G1HRQ4_9PEZI|nr:hypothetical protein EJ06DRAFT_532173 [Trichodelitschia bisporula]
MAEYEAVKFPILHQYSEDRNVVLREIPGLSGSDRTFFFAWASILAAYAGHSQDLIFQSDLDFVRVDFVRREVEHIEAPRVSASSNHTGVFFSSASIRQLSLSLVIDREKSLGQLRSFGSVPSAHLEQLALQLQHALAWFATDNPTGAPQVAPGVSLSISNPAPVRLSGPQLLHQLASKHFPEASCAIDFLNGDGSQTILSFAELDRRSIDLASHICNSLKGSTFATQPIIPLIIPQSAELYVTLVAILRTGCAFCPLNLDAPPERIRFIVEDVGAMVVVTTPQLRDRLSLLKETQILTVGDYIDGELLKSGVELFPVTPADTAYVMYTSGSTGQPKGVPVPHLSVTQSLLAHDLHVPQFSRFLQFASPTFDVSQFEIFFTLFRGSTLVGCDRTRLLSDLPGVMRSLGIDAAELTPTVAGTLLQSRRNAPELKLLLTIGEMLTPAVVEEFGHENPSESILWGMYGPTECAIHCTLQPAFSSRSKVGMIGHPLGTVSAFVAEPAGPDGNDVKILPLGHVGELVLGGHQLASGYLNRLEQTSATFIESSSYGRLYRTGDKARMLPDLSIECLGRMTSGQVKLRGQRLELGEIEHAVTRADGCIAAAVSVIDNALVAFCLVDRDDVTPETIKTACSQWLPAFMIPGDFVLLPSFPHLASGKVDKRALEEKYTSSQLGGTSSAQSRNPKVQEVCDILEEVTGRSISPDASLSALDSLLAIPAANQLRLRGFHFTPLDLLQAASVSALYAHGDEEPQKQNPHRSAAEDIDLELWRLLHADPNFSRLSADVEATVTPTQLQVSMLAETAKNPLAYSNSIEFELPAGVDPSDIRVYLQQLSAHNSILRSGFYPLESPLTPFAQIIWKDLEPHQVVDVVTFSRDFSLDTYDSLLRPIHFQICNQAPAPRILVHLHHALYDGWTIDLLVKDLNCLIRRQPVPQRPLFKVVADHYRTIEYSEASTYWQSQLLNFNPVPLPNFNGYIPSSPGFQRTIFGITTPLCKLRTCARKLQVSPQSFFQAALLCILGQYLESSDVTIGTVISGRTIPVPQVEEILGPCMTSLPLRVNVSHSKRAVDLLKNVHALNRQMLQYSGLPLISVKRFCDLGPGTQLWDVLFVWQETFESQNLEESAVHLVDSFDQLENPLTVEIEPRGNEIVGRATYDTRLLPAAQVDLLFEQIDHLVSHFCEHAESPLDAPIRAMPEHILSVENPEPSLPRIDFGLAHAVEVHARENPESIALAFAPELSEDLMTESTLMYSGLNSRANRLAHALQHHAKSSDQLIAICMEKSVELYISILAVQKAGKGYLPITPGTPQNRISLIIKEAGVSLCLSRSKESVALGLSCMCRVLEVDSIDLISYPSTNLDQVFDSTGLAYAIFTSGSTGVPKGVLVTQQNIMSNIVVLSKMYPTHPSGRLLQSCSQAFDVSVFEIFFAWYTGMCLCSATNDVLFDDLERAIRRLRVTHLSLTPTVAALVDPNNVPSVQFLVTSGEGVTEKVMDMWAGRGLWQGYGPSETTNICTVNPKVSNMDSIRNIGPPLENTSVFVLDPSSDDLVPRGGVGELCFGGDQVFKGYLNMPDLTASKIISLPKHGRIYRSGDIGRLLTSGAIIYIRRADDQVKVRGQRVELGEINAYVLMDLAVLNCITLVAVDRHSKTDRLVTFWIPRESSRSDFSTLDASGIPSGIIKGLYERLNKTLPDYMLPSALIPVSVIPMTQQGKVDRRRLLTAYQSLTVGYLELVGQMDEESSEFTNWPEAERQIANALADVIGISPQDIKRGASFFSLGLDSLSAVSLSQSLRRVGISDISVSTILKNPTVGRLAQVLSSGPGQLPPVDRGRPFLSQAILDHVQRKLTDGGKKFNKILPCTPLQEVMIAASRSEGSNAYWNVMLFELRSPSPAQIRAAWKHMVSRHDILRTVFVDTEDLHYPFAQVVLDSYQPEWTSLRVSGDDDAWRAATSGAIDKVEALLDSMWPPYSFAIIEARDKAFFSFRCHHALYDATAISCLLQEVEASLRYENLALPVPYEPFLSQMAHMRSPEALTFWTKYLEGFTPRLLRASSPKSSAVFELDLEIPLHVLQARCREIAVSLLTLMQAAWAKTISTLLGEPDVCFGNVVSGRTSEVNDINRLVAPTFNTIPTRANMKIHASNMDLLRTLQESNAQTLPFQLTPLRSIQKSTPTAALGLFSTLLLLQSSSLELAPEIWTLKEEWSAMDLPIVLELIPNKKLDTARLRLHYDSSLLNEDQCIEVLEQFSSALDSCHRYPAAAIHDYSQASEALCRHLRERSLQLDTRDVDIENSMDVSLSPRQLKMRDILSTFARVPISKVKPGTTIYHLGIDSLSAYQLATKLRKSEGVEISAADILQHPSLTELAQLLENPPPSEPPKQRFLDLGAFETQHKQQICVDLSLSPDAIEAVLPCTPLQIGFISEFLRSKLFYVNYLVLNFWDVEYDLKIIQNAWKAVCNKHQMLRTGFAPLDQSEFPFAMIVYHSSDELSRVQSLNIEEKDLAAATWLRNSRLDLYNNLHRPSWRLAVQQFENETVLHLAIFHALYDAESLRIILDDFAAALDMQPLPSPSPIRPALEAILASSLIGAEENHVRRVKAKACWNDALKGVGCRRFPNLAPVDTFHARDGASGKSPKRLSVLEKLCSDAGCTLQAAGQAAWASLLAEYHGEQNVIFGTVLSGRDVDDSAATVAMPCLTTIPVPGAKCKSNRELLEHMMRFNADVRPHQFIPLRDIQRWTGRANEVLFDTIFAFQKLSKPPRRRPWYVRHAGADAEYAISVELRPSGDDLSISVTFAQDIIPLQQANIICEQFGALLCHILEAPDAPPGLPPKECNARLLSALPAKEPILPSPVLLLHQFVEVNAVAIPDQVAFEFITSITDVGAEARRWTFRQLNTAGDRIANLLHDLGVRPNSLVGICFDKCPEASFAILGILKAGCAYVAIDPAAPLARKAFIARDSGAVLILTADRQGNKFSNIDSNRDTEMNGEATLDIPIIYLDETSTAEKSAEPLILPREITPDDLCYCLYTSGTTGTPKGCLLTHENAVQAMRAFSRMFAGHWDKDSKWLQFASFHFDVSVLEQFWSWSEGVRVVSAPRDLIIGDLPRAINVMGITHIDLTPSLAATLHPNDVPTLREGVFITGGESLRQDILDDWGMTEAIYNGYGPTETTIGVTMYPRVPFHGKPSNIGAQFPNVGSFVLRPDSKLPVLRGAIGELCVAGKLVGRGYLNRPDLTQAKFPFLELFGQRVRVYRTGDLVRLLHDGTFVFCGRADDQVKLRGQRLEIGEINNVIKKEAPSIHDVATYVLTHPGQQREQLVSFLAVFWPPYDRTQPLSVVEDGEEATAAAIKSAQWACHSRLPGYMVPTHFIPVHFLPLNMNNKVDGVALKALYSSLSLSDLQKLSAGADAGTLSSEEEKICSIFRQALGIGKVEMVPDSNFFELGMDSISVMSFARALTLAGFIQAHPSNIMKNPSVRSLAEVLARSRKANTYRNAVLMARQRIAASQHRYKFAAANAFGIEPGNIEGIAPCTPLQEAMLSKAVEWNEQVYFSTFGLDLLPSVDLSKLRAAWAYILSACQILRTKFLRTDDGFVQVALKSAELPWDEVQVSSPRNVKKLRIGRKNNWWHQNRSDFPRPFELVLVTSLDGERRILYINIFHALYDGHSLELLLGQVRKRYWSTICMTGPSFQDALPHGPLRVESGAARAFWTSKLPWRGSQLPFTMPADKVKSLRKELRIANTKALEQIRRSLNVTHQAVIQACWVTAVSKYYGNVVPLGLVTHGRSILFLEARGVIGPMFNTIPFQIELSTHDSWGAVIQRCHDFNVSAHEFQHTPLRDILKWCKKPGRPVRLFDSLFVFGLTEEFQNPGSNEPRYDYNELWDLVVEDSHTDYPLAFEAKLDSTLKIEIEVADRETHGDVPQDLCDRFQRALKAALSDPTASISDFLEQNNINGAEEPSPSSIQLDETLSPIEWAEQTSALRREIAILAGVGEDDVTDAVSIFELGLNSIDAISLSSRLKKYNIHIPVSIIMQHPTIAKMASHIETGALPAVERTRSRNAEVKTHLKTFLDQTGQLGPDVEDVYPATPLQEAMFSEMLNSDFTKYYNHDIMKLAPGVDVERLHAVWQAAYEEHPILRTTFRQVGSPFVECTYAQVVLKPGAVEWRETTCISEAVLPELLAEIRKNALNSPYEKSHLQLTIVRIDSIAFLILSIPHALYDGWSINLLHRDVQNAYRGKGMKSISNANILDSVIATSDPFASAFWSDYLSGSQPCLLPSSPSTAGSQVHRKDLTSTLPASTLLSFCKKQGITMHSLAQTSWTLVLASFTHSLEVLYGLVLSGRDTEGAQDLLFPTMNTVAFRSVIFGTRSDMLRYTHDSLAAMRPYQQFPLRKAMRFADSKGTGLFNSLFIYQMRPEEDDAPGGLYKSVGGSAELECPVCVEMEAVGGTVIWRVACRDDTFTEDQTEELLRRLDATLASIVRNPHHDVITFLTDTKIRIGDIPAFDIGQATETAEAKAPKKDPYSHRYESTTLSPTEHKIRAVLSAFCGVPEAEITPQSSILTLGLDSISAIRIVPTLRQQGLAISVSELLRANTLRAIARLIDTRTSAALAVGAIPGPELIDEEIAAAALANAGLTAKEVESIIPATAGQVYALHLWSHSRGAFFYPTFTHAIPSSVPLDKIQSAWTTLVATHPILRTVFIATFGIERDRDLPIGQAVLRSAPSALGHRKEQPYATLAVEQGDEAWVATLKIHHALYDAVSLPRLWERLDALIADKALEPVPYVQPALVGLKNRERYELMEWWSKYLYVTPPPLLPKAEEWSKRVEVFHPGLVKDIKSLIPELRRRGLGIQHLVFAAWARVYWGHCVMRQEGGYDRRKCGADVIIGAWMANRALDVDGVGDAVEPVFNVLSLKVKNVFAGELWGPAEQIKDGLEEIGKGGRSLVGLGEVDNWKRTRGETRKRVDTAVNFLGDLGGESGEGFSREVENKGDDEFQVPEELQGDWEYEDDDYYENAYQATLDVEVAVRDGNLDVGIFAYREMIGLEAAEGLMKELKMRLEHPGEAMEDLRNAK